MKQTRNQFLRWWVGACIAVGFSLASADAADPPTALLFDWRVTGTVTRFAQGSGQETTTRRQLNGTGTITVVRDPSPDVRFAFDFASPDGGGSGMIPRAAEDAVDPNFSFPNPLPPGLPPADARSLRGAFRRSGQGRVPPTFQIAYSETFICRRLPDACGNVKRWDVVFVGNAQSSQAPPRR